MTDIVTAIYELMGRSPDSNGPEYEKIKEKVETIFLVSTFYYNNSLYTLFSHVSKWIHWFIFCINTIIISLEVVNVKRSINIHGSVILNEMENS